MTYYRILSLDGGGIRGVMTTILLSRLEKACPGFLEKVDLIAGTSTGGILGLALAAGLPPETILKMYIDNGPKIFNREFWDEVRDLSNLIGADYDNVPLANAIKEIIGDISLGELKKKVLISSFMLDCTPPQPGGQRAWKAKFFENFPWEGSDSAEKVVDVALRTSAAPTYFPIYQGYVDGGVVANNPSMCALAQALNPDTGKQTLDQVTLLSIGTGTYPNFLNVTNASWGMVQWAPHVINLMMEGGSGLADYQCRQILGNHYLRINPVMPNPFSLDAITQIPLMTDLAMNMDLSAAEQWLGQYYA